MDSRDMYVETCKRSYGGGVHTADEKNKAIYMYVNNVGIRKIGRMLGVSSSVVLGWIRKAGIVL